LPHIQRDSPQLLADLARTGACSMALGEWLSVTNARELAQTQIAKEAATSAAPLASRPE
jgi:VIT1/CCC1 family predicted Fe2+/Mn2+ transporter